MCVRCGRLALLGGRYCATHEAGVRAVRAFRGYDSPGWRRLRAAALQRDGGWCQLRLEGCTGRATTVHLRPELGGDHRRATLEDCVSACRVCHGRVDGGRAREVVQG